MIFWKKFLKLKQLLDAKILLKRLPPFSDSKNYGNPACVTKFKAAVKIADPKSAQCLHVHSYTGFLSFVNFIIKTIRKMDRI